MGLNVQFLGYVRDAAKEDGGKNIVMANPNVFLSLVLWKCNRVVYMKGHWIVVQGICSPRTLQSSTTWLLI